MKPLIKSDCKKIIQKLFSIIRVSHLFTTRILKVMLPNLYSSIKGKLLQAFRFEKRYYYFFLAI